MIWEKIILAVLLSLVVGSVMGIIEGLLRNQDMDLYASMLIGASGAVCALVVFLVFVRNKINA